MLAGGRTVGEERVVVGKIVVVVSVDCEGAWSGCRQDCVELR